MAQEHGHQALPQEAARHRAEEEHLERRLAALAQDDQASVEPSRPTRMLRNKMSSSLGPWYGPLPTLRLDDHHPEEIMSGEDPDGNAVADHGHMVDVVI